MEFPRIASHSRTSAKHTEYRLPFVPAPGSSLRGCCYVVNAIGRKTSLALDLFLRYPLRALAPQWPLKINESTNSFRAGSSCA